MSEGILASALFGIFLGLLIWGLPLGLRWDYPGLSDSSS